MEPGDPKTGHSKMFTEADVPRLWAQAAPSFFARKFPTTPRMDKALSERLALAAGDAGKGNGRKARARAKSML